MHLEELLTPETICLYVCEPDPIRLVHEAGRLLVECGGVEERYIDAMEQALRTYGPYMVIVPGVALLHARPQDGVKRLCMSLLILDCPVAFGHQENDPVSLVFAFGAVDREKHVQALATLAKLMASEQALAALRTSVTTEDVLKILVAFST
jgi:mannitol/fructose-specific phosphotransferase system IIA component (Ntr-type)